MATNYILNSLLPKKETRSNHHEYNKTNNDLSMKSISDSGFNSIENNHHNSTSMPSFSFSKLNRIDEDCELISKTTPKSPLTTPTTTSIRKLNALRIHSPNNDYRHVVPPIKSSLKRVALPMEAIQENEFTPKKSKPETIIEKPSRKLTPIKHVKQLSENSQKNDYNLSETSEFNRTPLSPIVSSKSNIQKNKKPILKLFQKSLSTSTPKLMNDCPDLMKNITRSGSPLKKKRLLKKFQSISPVKFLKYSENYSIDDENLCNVKKNLKFQLIDSKEIKKNDSNTKFSRQKSIGFGADTQKNQTDEKLEVINEEIDSSFDFVTRDAKEGDTWCNSLSFNDKSSFNMKINDLVKAPIINSGSKDSDYDDNVFYTPTKQKKSSANRKPLKRLNALDVESPSNKKVSPSTSCISWPSQSLCDSFVCDKVEENLSIPSINLYFNKMKERSLVEESFKHISLPSLNDSSKKSIILEFNPRDSMEMLAEKIPSNDELNIIDTEILNIDNKKQIIVPKTPTKLRKNLKRLTGSYVIPKYGKTSRTTYEGIHRLNILEHLKKFKPVLDIIFNYLTGKDLVNVAMVSKSWKNIVENNSNSRWKRLEYLQKTKPFKENVTKLRPQAVKGRINRIPLGHKNAHWSNNSSSIDGGSKLEESPKRSPSKFNENQRLVRRLNKNVKLTKCPFCDRSCEIVSPIQSISPKKKSENSPRKCLFSSSLEYSSSSSQNKLNLKKSTSLPSSYRNTSFKDRLRTSNSFRDSRYDFNISEQRSNSIFEPPSILPNSSIELTPINKSLFNQDSSTCSRCNYTFCVNCHGEIHPNRDCPSIDSYSPGKEDDKPIRHSLVGSKQSRKNLKRLCN